MAIISVHNLVKHYQFYRKEAGLWGTIKALFYRKTLYAEAVGGISFSIEPGEVVGFLGPNGAGKTTTLKMLSGILYPTSGDIKVLGFRPQDRKNEFKRQFGIVMGQKDQLSPLLPAMDSFLLMQAFYQIPDREFYAVLDELVDLLTIREFLNVPLRKLSLGQRMKCELVGALLHNPSVLFLDEPTIGLDVVAQKNIRDFIKKYNQQKKTTIILTSHYMDDIRELCERVIIINFGKIIYDGKLSDLMSEHATEKLITITTATPVASAVLTPYGTIEEQNDVQVSIRVPRAEVRTVASKLMSSELPITDIEIAEIPIDDIIRAIFISEQHST